ncbi:MAG: tyrosine-type recombinase/integrase [Ignavibacteriales bacterium]
MASLVYKYGSYYAIFSVSGKKHWIRIGKVDKPNARKILKQLELAQAQKRLNLLQPQQLTLVEFMDKFLDYAKANKARNTLRSDRLVSNLLKREVGNIPLDQFNREAIEAYKCRRVNSGLKPSTINGQLAVISDMLQKAVDWGYLPSNPFHGIKMIKVTKQPPKLLTQDEIDRLIDAASLWLKPMLIVLRNTGLRVYELLCLRWADIARDRHCVTARSNKTSNYRLIPMNAELYQILSWLRGNYVTVHGNVINRQPSQMEYVFCSLDGAKLKTIQKAFYKCCTRAGIKAYPHLFRHSFASHLVMQGVDLPSVKELLGHTQISTTIIYSHLSQQHKANAVGKLLWAQTQSKLTLIK